MADIFITILYKTDTIKMNLKQFFYQNTYQNINYGRQQNNRE